MRQTLNWLMLVQLLLTGCAGQQATIATTPGAATAEHARASEQHDMANPYLQARPTVPAEVQRRFAQAQALIDQQEWQAALVELRALAEAHPTLSGAALDLALLYWQLGDAEQAGRWFERSIANNASNIDAYNEYGIFLRAQGQFAHAEAIYLLALEQWEASANTHRNIGILYDLYVGEPRKALQHYQRYQVLTGATDPEVAGWIADLERRQQSIDEDSRS